MAGSFSVIFAMTWISTSVDETFYSLFRWNDTQEVRIVIIVNIYMAHLFIMVGEYGLLFVLADGVHAIVIEGMVLIRIGAS